MTPSKCARRGLILLAVVFAAMAAATAVVMVAGIDLKLAASCYSPTDRWVLGQRQPWLFLYRYGTIPGLILTLGALVGWLIAMVRSELSQWRRPLMLVVLTSVLGAGVLVNAVLKPYWGRPRPSQIEQFGGPWEYREPTEPGTAGRGESFPCGHCTMGYLFVTLFFLRDRSRWLAYAGGIYGIAVGALLSAARILQGAHFLSDTLWSLGVILATAVILHYFILRIPVVRDPSVRTLTPRQRLLLGAAVLLIAAVMTLVFLTRRPFYETIRQPIRLAPQTTEIIVVSDTPLEGAQVVSTGGDPSMLMVHSAGFGWTSAELRVTVELHEAVEALRIHIRMRPSGYFSELGHRVEIRLPRIVRKRVSVRFIDPAEGGETHKQN